ncbi:hypothetical protein E7T06_07160 [Deinococcus sp. Arct2-2]|uniref:hypothetical protein n=1 Tax=Deinococcus sp. Arct2-2 TaxID=2568653 RepID=UPI0010A42685|nr:hypothetical protein [Deinococcus sp. Arct2-2]THF70477.1 hypothetical protein E7T06_07160 [Deinococcus sp. Arct2-2]
MRLRNSVDTAKLLRLSLLGSLFLGLGCLFSIFWAEDFPGKVTAAVLQSVGVLLYALSSTLVPNRPGKRNTLLRIIPWLLLLVMVGGQLNWLWFEWLGPRGSGL